jgi:hypothetical protein
MPPQFVSIEEAADIIVNRLIIIAEFQSSAMQPKFLSESGSVGIDISEMGAEAAKAELSNWFVQEYREEVKNDVGEDIISVDVKRRLGWSGAILIDDDDGKELLGMLFQIGGTHPYFLISRLKQGRNKDYCWYKQLLSALVDEKGQNPALIGGVNINSSYIYDKFNRASVEFELGWINYFSNSFPLELPDDMDAYRYEKTESGQYLTLTYDDITESKEKFESYCDQVIEYMEKMKDNEHYGSGDSHPLLKKMRDNYNKNSPLYEVPSLNLSHTGKRLD